MSFLITVMPILNSYFPYQEPIYFYTNLTCLLIFSMYVVKCFPFLSHLLGAAKEKVRRKQYISLYFLGFFTELCCIGSMDFKIMTIKNYQYDF